MNPALFNVLSTPATMQSLPVTELFDDNPDYTKFIMFKAEGRPPKLIAQMTGYSIDTVRTVLRQPWAKQKLRELISLSGGDTFMQAMVVECPDSLDTLIELRDNSKSDAVRADCAKEIINRVYGKPVQMVNTKAEPHIDVKGTQEELEELDKEIQEHERSISFQRGRLN